ncbi:MAG: hypothetical protein ACON5H_04710 [Akkermansiaceae bacterium]
MKGICRIRIALIIVIFGLVISGITAFPLLHELNFLASLLTGGSIDLNPQNYQGFTHWILKVREGLEVTYENYPFIAYGTDWLAFAHLMIALFFILPYRDPIRYEGVMHVGIWASLLVFPLALICGAIREIPIGWQLIDCSFGVVCIPPLLYAIKLTRWMASSESPES